MLELNKIHQGDSLEVLKKLPSEAIDCIMTSPPYWALRNYNIEKQLGLEKTFEEYINRLCDVFDEVKRVLKKDGTCFVNIGDTYMGNSSYSEKGRQGFGKDKIGMINKKQWLDPKYPHKEKLRAREHIDCDLPEKSLCMIPFRFAIEMVNRGWILRNTIIWHKPNAMPSSVKDRFNVDFEYLFFFTKSKRYNFETQQEPLSKNSDVGYRQELRKNKKYDSKQPYQANFPKSFNLNGRTKRTVWSINTKPLTQAHFATYPEELCYIPIKAGCKENGVVLDPFFGAGTTGVAALKQNKKFVGIELNPEYIKIAQKRIKPFLSQTKLMEDGIPPSDKSEGILPTIL